MKKKLIIFWAFLITVIVSPSPTIAQCPQEGCPEGTSCTIFNECLNLSGFIDAIITWGMGIIATLCVLMLIVAGFQYITSAGNPEAVESAKKTIQYAIGGLILLAMAYIIIDLLVPIG